MSLFALSIIFFLGACMGSFSAVLLGKKSSHRSFWTGRSHCEGCKKTLQWYELIPLVSYPLQSGKCRSCSVEIPRWIWFLEWYMAFLWMSTAMVLSLIDLSLFSITIHIILLTWFSLLVIEDMRSQTIPDTQSMPLMVCMVGIFVVLAYYPTTTLLPSPMAALVWAFVWMLFYMVQMIIPTLYQAICDKRYRAIGAILIAPILFPLWLITKAIFWEETADRYFSLLSVFDSGPVWVWGGDIRLGIIIWALVGPYYFLFVVMYGYVLGTGYFLTKLLMTGKKIKTLPVAPLLFFGLCVIWCLRIFA